MRKMKENACNNKNQKKNPGFLLSAVSSNSGKTAAACGLMSAFKQEGERVCACKCGPDYIDPLFLPEFLPPVLPSPADFPFPAVLQVPDAEILQVSAARSKVLGRYHMMMGQNPVYIISAGGRKPGQV